MDTQKVVGLGVVFFYLIMMFVIGWYTAKRTKNIGDFYLGGRSLGPWALALTYCATSFSTSLLVGNAGLAYKVGFAQTWIAPAQAMATLIAFMFFQARYRSFSIKLKAIDVPDFLGERYKSNLVRGWSASLIFVLQIGYIVAVTKGMALLLQTLVGVPYWVGVLVAGTISTVYITAGGYLADVYSDVVQGVIMIVGVLILAPVVIHAGGGLAGLTERLAAIDPRLITVPGAQSVIAWLTPVLVFSIGTWGQPQHVVRLFTLKHKKHIAAAAVVATIFTLVIVLIPNLLGAYARVIFPNLAQPDLAFPMLVTLLPVTLGYIILCAALAAGMSTTDSVILVASSALCRDLIQKVINPKISDQTVFKMGRWVSFAIGIIGTLMALKPPPLLLLLTVFIWGCFASGLMAPLLYGIYWKGATTAGAAVSMIGGSSLAIIWQLLNKPFGIHPLFPGVIFAFVALPLVSWFTRQLPADFVSGLFTKSAKARSPKIGSIAVPGQAD